MSDLSQDELDFTRLSKGLVDLKGLYEMEKKYKDKPKILNKIYEEMANKTGANYE